MREYGFDRYLRYDELAAWLRDTAAAHPELMAVEAYGRSHEGRELLIATITDTSSGSHDTKPAHWIDANIHSVELTAGVAALHIIHRLVTGFGSDPLITRALQRRTFDADRKAGATHGIGRKAGDAFAIRPGIHRQHAVGHRHTVLRGGLPCGQRQRRTGQRGKAGRPARGQGAARHGASPLRCNVRSTRSRVP